jgi:negative regulator of sigma E activity
MNSLESRKQLLIAESELNRAQLVQEWRTMAGEVHSLTSQARSISSIASAVATLVAGLSSLRPKASAPAAEKPSWWQTILKGAGLASSFWQAFRSQGCGQEEK